MPTARSSTDPVAHESWSAALSDLGHLLRFRATTVRRRRAAGIALTLLLAVTAGVMLLPALLTSRAPSGPLADGFPAMLGGFLVLAVAAAVGGGGGREVLPRDQLAIHPISTRTEHLGALALSPLNFAFMLQAWTLLGIASSLVAELGWRWLGSQATVLAWLACATAVAQLLAWSLEIVRRGEHGALVMRMIVVAVAGVGVALQYSGVLLPLLNASPARLLLPAARGEADAPRVVVGLVVVAAAAVAAVALGALPARAALSRQPREELKVESGSYVVGPLPPSDHAMLVRLDRASVWRSVPMRRGLLLLALGPGLVALVGGTAWSQVMILPGLVVSGGALLFGVNAWCLDARGVLWRESLPVTPGQVFWARARVLAEVLVGTALVTMVLASLRAGAPTASEIVGVVVVLLVVTLQVVAVSLTWSARRPYAASMSSARSTPAPPATMAGYSARLATATTLTALLFTAAATGPVWLPVAMAVPFLAWSGWRLRRARRGWIAPAARARVAMAVAG